MAETLVNIQNQEKQWDDKFWVEYVAANRFKAAMGSDENSIIQLIQDLTKKKGDTVSLPLIGRMTGSGVRGNNTLEGNEEQMDNYGFPISVFTLRNAVVVTDDTEQKTSIQLRDAGRTVLKMWEMGKMRDGIITALMSQGPDKAYLASQALSDTNYSTLADETAKDLWLTNNVDRVLYGKVKSNLSAGDNSVSLATIDSTNDVMTAAMVTLAKEIAEEADPHITPVKVGEDDSWFVMYCNGRAFRDLKNDTAIIAANREAWTAQSSATMAGGTNPLFRGGDLIWDGVIIKKIPEIPVIPGVGNGGIDVAPNFLCGAQALGVAWAMRPKSTINETDYKFKHGIGVHEMKGVAKVVYDNTPTGLEDIQHGVVTVYAAGVATS